MGSSFWILFSVSVIVAALIGIVSNSVRIGPLEKRPLVAVLVIVVLLAGSIWISYDLGHLQNKIDVTITTPSPNESTVQKVPFQGTIRGNLPTGYKLWAEVHADEESRFHTANGSCDVSGGQWNCGTIFAGQPQDTKGKGFTLSIYETDVKASADLTTYGNRPINAKDYFYGLTNMPIGSTLVATVHVTRQ